MSPEELQRILTVAGYRCRIHHKEEVVLAVCVFCGNEKGNLELNPSRGVYHCWACRSSGRLERLLKQLTGQEHRIQVRTERKKDAKAPEPTDFQVQSVDKVGSALQYLERRGITPTIAARYGLAMCMTEGHRLYGRIVIPMLDYFTGERVGWVGRSYTGAHPKYMSTFTHSVITGWRVRDKRTPTVVVEGPFDGITVHRAGYHAAVLSGVHATEVELFAARLPMDAPLVIMLDADAEAMSSSLYWKLLPLRPTGMTHRALLPEGSDPGNLAPNDVRQFIDQIVVRSGPGTSS